MPAAPEVPPPAADAPAAAAATVTAVVVNSTKLPDPAATRAQVTAAFTGAGRATPLWLETTAEDPGYAATEQALRAGAGLVMACGGDGTVRAVLTVLSGTGVPLAVLPTGTGNLLARNLGLPLGDLDASLRVALIGRDRAIDVARLESTHPQARAERFAVMAGIGFDAAVMRDTGESAKARLGWPAYLLSAARHLRRPGVRVRLRIDDGPTIQARAQTVIVANLGRLQGGIELLPHARPDDGALDIAIIASTGLVDWLRITARVLTRSTVDDHRLRTFTGRRVRVTLARPQPRQADGDLLDPGALLGVELEPLAILIRVP